MTAAAAEPAQKCSAVENDGLKTCERCGLQWLAGVEKPACDPITLARLYDRMADEVSRGETSLAAMRNIEKGGKVPADSGPAMRRLAEIDAVRRLILRCQADPEIKKRLNSKPKTEGDSK
jgi:hypothetical protein